MIDIEAIHQKSMDIAKAANLALDRNDRSSYLALIAEALKYETEAAMDLALDFQSEPTRSILFRSAAYMAYNIGQYDHAKRMIHLALSGSPFNEIKEELETLSELVADALTSKVAVAEAVTFTYMSYLREQAVNLKLNEKSKKFDQAVGFDAISDLIKSLQTSFKNFCEINFKSTFTRDDFFDFEKATSQFRKYSKLLCVGLEFQSFGISVVADSTNIDFGFFESEKFVEFKRKLFQQFKTEVLLSDYESLDFQAKVKQKYTEEERLRIFNTIASSTDEKSPYTLAVTDKNFKKIIKSFKPLHKSTKSILVPTIEFSNVDESRPLKIKRTLNLTDDKGVKKAQIQSELLDYAEFKILVNTIKEGGRTIYFINDYPVKIIFDNGIFIINDTIFDIYLEGRDLKILTKSFEQIILDDYFALLYKENLNLDEKLKLNNIQSLVMNS